LVPPGASVVLPRSGESQPARSAESAQPPSAHPRLRSGYALKRLDAAEGERRWVLKDLVGRQIVRLSDSDASLLRLLDGQRSVADLIAEAEQLLGSHGPARLALLLSGLSARGLLAGSSDEQQGPPDGGRLQRLFKPRKKVWAGAGDAFERVYRGGGWLLFTAPVLAALAATGVAGLGAFIYLIGARYGTPFVVASKVGLGGLVFIVGRLFVAAVHEAAHGLALTSYGRRVGEAGVKLVLIPYTFVDTSDAWFEPRRRRIAVSAAGPACDLVLGGAFALCCLMTPPGPARDIFFQLAFGAYYGALFNLNPLLDRDGYQILVDVVREPGLRRRGLQQLRRRLAGRGSATDSPILHRYAVFALAWMIAVAGFAAALSLRYLPVLATVLPRPVAWTLLAATWATLLALPLMIVVPPLLERRRSGRA